MAARERVICSAADLVDGGDGIRFETESDGARVPAFAVRFAGRVHAYVNRCAHVAMELDWMPGKFFDFEKFVLVCSTHGAMYDPQSGECAGGPCKGRRLLALDVRERDGAVIVYERTGGEHG
jgi:nitrite reductase/ring-hydroxylating ferredoxin subunit